MDAFVFSVFVSISFICIGADCTMTEMMTFFETNRLTFDVAARAVRIA